MKRYRVTDFFVDTTRTLLREGREKMMSKEHAHIKEWLTSKHGEQAFDQKLQRFLALQKPPISVVAEHTFLLEDISQAYVQGSFYSALTATCCLGERRFNDIIFKVMNEFRGSKHYKRVCQKGSIIDWGKAIEILKDWRILDTHMAKTYRQLHRLRIESVHFRKESQDLEQMSLTAINDVNYLIKTLFGVGPNRKDILLRFEVPGEVYLRKMAETDPIAKAFYIPCSKLVGPRHTIENGAKPGEFVIVDADQYEKREISDAKFVELRKQFMKDG